MTPPLLGKQALQALGTRLRDIRRDAGLTGRELAEACGWGPSKVSKVEHGRQVPAEADVRDWCIACRAPSEIPDLVAALRQLDAQYVDWRRTLSTGTKRRQQANVAAYERTSLFRVWEPAVVPGLLQTAGYAREILATVIDFHGIPDDVEAGVRARMEAQQVLVRGDRRFLLLVGETALHTRVGDAGVMRGQLARLVEAARMPRVSLGVVPLDAPYTVPRNTGFTIYDGRSVTVATYTAELTLQQRHEVAVYEKAFDRLAALAVYGGKARELIDRAVVDLEEI